MTCSAIWGLLDKDDDLGASHELLNTEIISEISQIGAVISLVECDWVGQPRGDVKIPLSRPSITTASQGLSTVRGPDPLILL